METSEFIEMLETEFRGSEIERNPDRLAPLWAELERFFAGEPVDFDFPVDLSALTPFQQAVLEATRAIPPGQVMTYGQIAAAVGRPRASRAVGQALRRNPVPFVIPCHRVVGSDGSMRGYGGPSGVQLKEQLLALEEQN
jgi:O-6-methylguanine DNA methyltransferase